MKRSKKIAAGTLAASLAFSTATLAGCTAFEPNENEVVDVYGPPIDEEYGPEDNSTITVYGPPEELGLPADEDEGLDAEENATVGVYGPPEDLALVEQDEG